VNEAGLPQPIGTIGEVSVRSIANMTGYWNDPAANAEVFQEDGWMRTGDAGSIDEDGYLFIHDRIKDVIISGASNIYPAEVESAIYGHPDVAGVAVIGVPDARWGESVKAIVVPKPGHAVDPESIIAWARTRIAGYKAPRSVDVVPALPLNASGKVQRRELRRPYWEGRDRQI
jgi:long-chain acyl-CoA synthetase